MHSYLRVRHGLRLLRLLGLRMLFLRSRLYTSHPASVITVSNRVQRVQLGRRHSLARMRGHHGIASHFLRRFG